MWAELDFYELWERGAQLEEKMCADDATSCQIAAYEAELDVIRMQIEDIRQGEG